MADYDLTTITNALAQNYRPKVVRTFNATSILLRTLRIERGAGKNIAWDVENGGAYAENFADGADVSTYGSDVPAPATLQWGLYRANWLLTNLAKSAARSSMSPSDLLRPEGRNLINAIRKLTSTINGVMYTGAGTGTTLAGLNLALDDANTYATINRTTGSNSHFRAKVFDPGTDTEPTLKQIRKDLYDIKDQCGELPDLAFVSSATFLKLCSLFDDVRRWQQDITVNLAKGQVVLDASVGKLQIEGCTFIADKDATAGYVYYLNSNYVHVEYLPSESEDIITEEMVQASADDGMGPMPLGMNVYALARAGASRKFTAEVQMNLVVEKPNACGLRKHVLLT
jgi:hypothetical protein